MSKKLPFAILLTTLSLSANATVISFDGGKINGVTLVPENRAAISLPVNSFYVEDGMKVSFNDPQDTSNFIGDYYNRDNNVLHWHGIGSSVRFELLSGGAFNLNSFVVTSNTQNGGSIDTGREDVFVRANNGQSFKLPTNGWGATELDQLVSFNGSLFKGITSFSIDADSDVFCIGIDNLSFDVASVPEPGSLALLGLGGAALLGIRRRQRA